SAGLAVILVILAAATFVSLALLLRGRLRAETTLGVANLIYGILVIGGLLILGLGGALIIPLERFPAALRPVIEALPTAALGEGLRAAANGQLLGWPGLVLLAWLLAPGPPAWKGVRWPSVR